MQPTTKWITGTLAFAGLTYALSPGPRHLLAHPNGWEFREQFVYLTGVCALSLMVLSTTVSVRIPWLNRRMRGLDKAYVIHKWTGIFATVLTLFHWLGENAPHWLVEAGLIPNPGELTDGSQYSDLEINLFQSGTTVAQIAFYGTIALVVVALFNRIPYRIFRKSHKVFPVLILLAAYHGATAQLKEHWLGTPGSYLLFLLVAVGVVAALIALFQQIGASRKTTATVSQITRHADILDLHLTTSTPFQHQPGQYAFLRFAHDGEPHPFTIASSGDDPQRLRFAIKSLGDFTGKLAQQVQVGQAVTVEGPYGEFQFDGPQTRQIWIAGGIGITPFMARLDHLAKQGGNTQPIDFWYSTRSTADTVFPDNLAELCQRSGVTYRHLDSTHKQYLTAEMIHQAVGDFTDVSIWFCGPPAFANRLLRDLPAYGFDPRRLHYDSFTMR